MRCVLTLVVALVSVAVPAADFVCNSKALLKYRTEMWCWQLLDPTAALRTAEKAVSMHPT